MPPLIPDSDTEDEEETTIPTPKYEPDYWERKGYYIVRVHRTPRTLKFTPIECDESDPPPIPMKHIDLKRITKPEDLDEWDLRNREDVWTGHESDKAVLLRGKDDKPITWIGQTWFVPIAPIHPRASRNWIFIYIYRYMARMSQSEIYYEAN